MEVEDGVEGGGKGSGGDGRGEVGGGDEHGGVVPAEINSEPITTNSERHCPLTVDGSRFSIGVSEPGGIQLLSGRES